MNFIITKKKIDKKNRGVSRKEQRGEAKPKSKAARE
jgi:hypothetical protein